MKKNFVSGLFAGVLTTVLVVSLILLGFERNENNSFFGLSKSDSSIASTSDKNNNGGSSSDDTDGGESSAQSEALLDKKLDYIKSIINTYYMGEVTDEEYSNGMLKGLLQALEDPYSCYYTEQEYNDLMQSSEGVYYGIGSYVSQNASTGIITLTKPFVGGPAYKAGVLPGDILYKVNGVEVTGKDLSTVVSEMKGEKGTNVTISVMRENESEPLDFEITRDEIEVPTVEYEMLADNIGYISVVEFDKITVPQFKDAVDDLEKQGMKGLVIDLRNNPGGLYDSAVEMLDYMLPKGLVVYTETKNGKREESFSTAKDEFKLPLTVLINGNSASASEIFAGAIQDYEKGTIVGTQSFGKGIVQSVIPLGDGSAIKITVSKYYTPSGRNIHGLGITPDVEVELDDELKKQVVITHDEDNQLQKAISVLKEKTAK